jgi:hypothetical protein
MSSTVNLIPCQLICLQVLWWDLAKRNASLSVATESDFYSTLPCIKLRISVPSHSYWLILKGLAVPFDCSLLSRNIVALQYCFHKMQTYLAHSWFHAIWGGLWVWTLIVSAWGTPPLSACYDTPARISLMMQSLSRTACTSLFNNRPEEPSMNANQALCPWSMPESFWSDFSEK